MTKEDEISFDGTSPLSKAQIQHIKSFICNKIIEEESDSDSTMSKEQQQQKANRISDFLQYLDRYYIDSSTDGGSGEVNNSVHHENRPTLLNICSGENNDIISIAAAKFNLCSQSIGLHTNEINIQSSKRLAFQQNVFNKCHFFQVNYNDDPKLLLDNPHFIADRINESDVVLIHDVLDADMITQLMPLLALLSSKRKNRKFVSCVHHIPTLNAVCSKLISGTELCVYDGIVDTTTDDKDDRCTYPPLPEPLHDDEIDKEFARSSIQHALPRRF